MTLRQIYNALTGDFNLVNVESGWADEVTNYSALPTASLHDGEVYLVLNSQGTTWLPGTLGGTFYSKGFYKSIGSAWEFLGAVPYQATQAQVNTGTATDVFVSPSTLANSTQWDSKVTANSTITGSTRTKVTYDSKGLITSGTDATTADVADSTNRRYVTDADLVDIGNLSGTNTGDNAVNTTSNTYADGKVADAITNGVTTIAPSQNAVFDALALKIGGSGTTNTIPLFSASTTLGDSTIQQSGTKVSINGAAFLRQFNVYGSGLDSRLFFHGPAASNPAVELATDATGTRRTLMRLAESGASGTALEFFTRPAAGGAVVQNVTIQDDGRIRNLPLAGTGTRIQTVGSTGIMSALTNGSDGQVLTLASGAPSWATPATANPVYPSGLAPLVMEFFWDCNGSNTQPPPPLLIDYSGAGAGVSNFAFGPPYTGYQQYSTGTVTNGQAYVATNSVFRAESTQTIYAKARVRLGSQTADAANTHIWVFGFSDSYTSATPTYSACFILSVGLATVTLTAYSRNGGVAETTSLTIPASANFATFEVIVNGTTNVVYYIDGVAVATHTTVPSSGSMQLAHGVKKSASTTARLAYVDFIAYKQVYTSR